MKRSGSAGLPANVVAQIFNVGLHGAGSARMEDGSRVIFQVVDDMVPPIDFAAPDLVAIAVDVKTGLMGDILTQYITTLENELGVKVNVQAFATAAGARV